MNYYDCIVLALNLMFSESQASNLGFMSELRLKTRFQPGLWAKMTDRSAVASAITITFITAE